MKILNINRFYYLRGGADVYFFLLKDILEKNKHTVIPFSTLLESNIPTNYSKYFVEGFSEDTFPSLNMGKKVNFFFGSIYSSEVKKKIRRLIREEKPDIAHLHGIFYQLSLSVIDALKEQGIPSVMSLNDYFVLCANGYLFRNGRVCELCRDRRHSRIIFHKCYRGSFPPSLMAYFVKKLQTHRRILDSVDKFIVPTEEVKTIMADWGINKDKIGVVHNPFDAERYEPNFTFGDYIVFYGRLVRLKGIFTILEALNKTKNIKLKIFGSGPEQKEIEAYIAKNNMKNVEIDTNLRWGSELIKLISKARFVISAPEWFAPSDYVVYESFSLGKPVIASAIGGNLSLIKDGYNGLLFTPGDADALSEKIKWLYNNEASIVEMGKNARDFAVKNLNYVNFYDSLMEIYKSVLEKS